MASKLRRRVVRVAEESSEFDASALPATGDVAVPHTAAREAVAAVWGIADAGRRTWQHDTLQVWLWGGVAFTVDVSL